MLLAACVAAVATAVSAVPADDGPLLSGNSVMIAADEPAAVVELPAPADLLPGVAAELERLQRQID